MGPFNGFKFRFKIKSHFRRSAFDLSGVDIQSEEAFEMARRGHPRPAVPGAFVSFTYFPSVDVYSENVM